MNRWGEYAIECDGGTSIAVRHIVEVWARSTQHAFDVCRAHGLIPVALRRRPT